MAAALTACSTLRLAYNQADTVMYWWLDGYVAFTPEQAPKARSAIADWFEWNRRSELPQYAALLDTAAEEVLNDTTPARVCEWLHIARVRLDRAVQQSLPQAAVIAVSFDSEQLARLERKQAQAAAELREEYLGPAPNAQRAAAVERLRERAEQLYGRIDDKQRARLERGVAESPFDVERWLQERERRQRDLAQGLRAVRAGASATGGTPSADGADPLQAMWQRVKSPPDAGYRSYLEKLLPYNCALSADFHNATTAEQRQVAHQRLKAWRADLLRLASPG